MAFTKSFVTAVAALLASSSLVSAVPVYRDLAARKDAPADWWSGWEDYQIYHTRYNALGCKYQHNTDFFTNCCGPLYKDTTLAVRPDQCDPAKFPYTGTTASAKPTSAAASADGVGNDSEDCTDDEVDDHNEPDPQPTTSKYHAATKTSSEAPAETSKAADNSGNNNGNNSGNGGGEVHSGGFATFYTQNGNAGACGDVNPDDALIGAIDHHRWGKASFGEKSDLCGKKVRITNTNNKKTVDIIIADVCPTCENSESIDLSTGAFNRIATPEEGMVPITWEFV